MTSEIWELSDLRELNQLARGEAIFFQTRPQPFERHLQADLLAELEAVGHGLGRSIDLDRDLIDRMLLDTLAVAQLAGTLPC